jgi:hypothetical protein
VTAWAWVEVFVPRGITLDDVTAVTRVLVGRPRFGVLGLQPLVTFELWLSRDRARWLVGMDERIADSLPGELAAQCPGLVVAPLDDPGRPTPITGRELRFRSLSYPVRLDVAEGITAGLLRQRAKLRKSESIVIQWVVGPSQYLTEYPVQQTPLDFLGFTTPPKPDAGDMQAWRRKLTEPIYGVRGRVGAAAADLKRAASLTRPIFSALSLANEAHARVQTSPQSSRIAAQIPGVMGRARTWSAMLNAAELAVLLGWCIGKNEQPGNAGVFAPPPEALQDDPPKSANRGGRRLGVSPHPSTRGIRLTVPWNSYSAHTHLIGPSGAGKSTLLARWALDEAKAGRSVVVIEPKGDLVTDILSRLPKRRHGDVVVIDPGGDTVPVVGVNPLAGPRADAERRADSLLHTFRSLFGSAIGARSADVLLHALILAARLPDGCLTDVLPILTVPAFRHRVVRQVGDELITNQWATWFDELSEQQRGQIVAPIANKLRVFSSRPSVRRLLGQARPKFTIDGVFDKPRVVLVNLNAGQVGPETAAILGTLLLNQLWEAIQRQTTKPAAQRRPVSVFVDEWQDFTAGLDFADVLARARGARVPFTVAHQHLDQLSATLRSAVLANARSRVVFRPAEGDSRALAAVLGEPITPADLEALPAYHAAARFLVDAAPSRTFEITTPELPKPTRDADWLRRASAERYGIDAGVLDAAVLDRWRGGPPPSAPIGVRRRQS